VYGFLPITWLFSNWFYPASREEILYTAPSRQQLDRHELVTDKKGNITRYSYEHKQ
jgi:hypothetical protein